jgi:hypothetical protein
VIAGGVALANDHYGRQVRFAGPHPIPKADGGGFCYIEGPHVHIYAANDLEYRQEGPDHVFVGDPVAYGYDGPKYAYKGPHPIIVEDEDGNPHTEYCYIQGPHYHPFEPPQGPDFAWAGDAYFYVATPPPAFVAGRPHYVGINAIYQPMTYARPVVTVDAPSGWIGARPEFVVAAPGVAVAAPGDDGDGPGDDGDGPPAVVQPGVVVAAPGVVVQGPAVGIGVHVAVPPPPSISVGIGVHLGGGMVVGHPEHPEHPEHHPVRRGWHR